MQTPKEICEVLQAAADGKKCEYSRTPNEWRTDSFQDLLHDVGLGWPIRIAPTPKLRLLRPDELAGKWVKKGAVIYLVIGFDNGSILLGCYGATLWFTARTLHTQGYTYSDSPTGPWRSLEVEE